MKGIIYKITNPQGRIYVGQTVNIEDRINRYRRYQCKNQRKLYYSFKKHGFDTHIISTIEEVDIEILMEREKFWVEELKSNCARYPEHNGLNLCDGGIGTKGRFVSEETKRKIGASQKGKIVSEESRKKISLAGIGRKHSEEAKAKMSKTQKGKIISDETKAKISSSLKGRNGHCFKRSVEQLDLNTENIIENFDSATAAAKKLGSVSYLGNIVAVCRGRFKQAYGYKWRYK